jgi:hypothetical protein
MNRFRNKKIYKVEDAAELIKYNSKEQYETVDVAEMVSYVMPAYSTDEINMILHTAFKLIKILLMDNHKCVRLVPLCSFITKKYYKESKRWSYDLVPMLSSADLHGKGYDIAEDEQNE